MARKLYVFEFESVDQTKTVFSTKLDEIWGKDQKKVLHLKKIREYPQILVFISKNVQISINSEVKTKKKRSLSQNIR